MTGRPGTPAPFPWKLVAVAAIFVGITTISVALTFAAVWVQSAVRSYVAVEGQWAKAQRDAAFLLYRYGQTGDRDFLRRFEQTLAVPLGDRAARLAMEQPEFNRDAATRSFPDGANHPADVPSLVWLYRCCSELPQIRRMAQYWKMGDEHIIAFQSLAQKLEAEIGAQSPSELRLREMLGQVEDLNDSVSPIVAAFTDILGETARRVSSLLIICITTIVLLLVAAGGYLSLRIGRSIRSSEEQYRTLMHNASDGLIVVDRGNGQVLEMNECAERMIGRPAALLIGLPYDGLFQAPRVNLKRDLERTGAQLSMLRTSAGTAIPVEVNSSATVWNGRAAQLAIVRDVSERIKTERLLRIATNAMANMTEAVVITDERFRVVSVNSAFTAITGYQASEMAGRFSGHERLRAADSRALRRIARDLLRLGRWQGELQSVRKNGEAYPLKLSLAGVPDEDGTVAHYVGIFNDNSAFRDYERRLRHLANHDMLTDLPNRAAFEELSVRAIERANVDGRQLALLFIDLDGFKAVNDTYGHGAGDTVLRTIGERIRRCLRATDTVARVGGDEFNVLLDDAGDEKSVSRLARALLATVSQPITFEAHAIALSASIGISFYPRDAGDVDALVTHADMAMYEAKGRGRNNFQVFSNQLSMAARTRLTLVTGLRHAIERRQLELHYQPHTDLVTGRFLGLEALLRWNHPELGVVAPGHFIPLAEEIGVIDAISDWVLRNACTQGADWRARGMSDMILAVNLSPRNFWDQELPGRVALILAETGYPAELLCLEITEGTLMGQEDPEETLARLGELGVRLAIDDFGIGYSSLGSLRRFPVDVLKIDRTFTHGIPENSDNLALVRTIISLADGLGLTVIAEGVETRTQHDTLLAEGCRQGQGYLYGKPGPALQIEALLGLHQSDSAVLAAS